MVGHHSFSEHREEANAIPSFFYPHSLLTFQVLSPSPERKSDAYNSSINLGSKIEPSILQFFSACQISTIEVIFFLTFHISFLATPAG